MVGTQTCYAVLAYHIAVAQKIAHIVELTLSLVLHEYEVLIETINPCGGEAHAAREFKQIEAASPEAYVAAQGRYPVLDSGKNASGDTVITTGDGKGVMIRYTFTE